MSSDRALEMLEVLRANHGFAPHPERWLTYALIHGFKRVEATPRERCPDCGNPNTAVMGQYIFYSSLFRLRECTCGFAFADALLDRALVTRHFESAYKDDEYFAHRRGPVFEQIARLVARQTPRGASVLDVGGAKGHLLAAIHSKRPDLKLTLSDLSSRACESASRQYGLETICEGIGSLAQAGRCYDVVILSDVIYYEPDPHVLWGALPLLVGESGTLIIRAPNTAPLIRIAERLKRALPRRREFLMSRMKFYNPEHAVLFPRQLLARRLRQIGFANVRSMPGQLGVHGAHGYLARSAYAAAFAITIASRGRVIPSPSFVLVARRSGIQTTALAEASPRQEGRAEGRLRA